MRWSLTPTYYDKLDQSETTLGIAPPRTTNWTDRDRQLPLRLISILTSLSILLNVFLLAFIFLYRTDTCDVRGNHYRNVSLNANFKAASAYSPIFDEVDMHVGLTTANGALHDNTSIWRMPPSREVDAAWDSLTRGGLEIIAVSAADITLSGKDPALSVKAPSSWDQGPDAYLAQIEILHVLHCLDEVRKEMWSEYYYDNPSDASRRELKAHCVHTILQNLLCTADVGIIRYNWMHDDRYPGSRTIPVPDFSLVKQCRNFDALLEWTIDRRVPDWPSKWNELQVPDDAVVLSGDIPHYVNS